MRRFFRVLALILASTGCTDWERFSADYDGDGVCPTFVVAGDVHSCARKSNGTLRCWGDNRSGELGTGDTATHANQVRANFDLGTLKVYVPTGNGDITSDRTSFTCVVATDSNFWCWGDNRLGQLGTGNTQSSSRPVRIPALDGKVAKAATGSGHVCVQTNEGGLLCWGRNVDGELGVGDTSMRTTPTRVDIGRPSERLTTGGGFSCARGTDATLFCWGGNALGQLGIGSTIGQTVPVEVKNISGRIGRIAAGGAHACAFTEDDGQVWCWGDNRVGQLGTGDTEKRLVPTAVKGTSFRSVRTNELAGGGSHTCALRDDNTLWCWGGNRYGQLGTGDTEPRTAPVQILSGVSQIYAGGAHTCALGLDGSVSCWGNNQYGQLGAAVGPQALVPTQAIAACP